MKLSRNDISHLSYEPGQYFFINIPDISLNEWHPFTATAILDDSIVFCIKRLKSKKTSEKRTWTQRLAERAQSITTKADEITSGAPVTPLPLALRLSGPFGHTDFTSYERLLLVAGGIGITPMIAIFANLKKRQLLGQEIGTLKHVQLVWMSRSVGEFRLFEEVLSLLAEDGRKALDERRGISSNRYATLNANQLPQSKSSSAVPTTFGNNSMELNPEDIAPVDVNSVADPPTALVALPHQPVCDKAFEASLATSPWSTENMHAESGGTAITKNETIFAVDLINSDKTSPSDSTAKESQGLPSYSTLLTKLGSDCLSNENHACIIDAGEEKLVNVARADGKPPILPCDPVKAKRLSVASFGEQDDLSIPCTFDLSLYCTRRASFALLTDPNSVDYVNLFLQNGRCNLKETFRSMGMNGNRCMAAVCGPAPLMLDVSELARIADCDFHSEQFLL